MGVDCKLYVRTSVEPQDIVDALKALGKKNVRWLPTHTAPGYHNVFFKSEVSGWEDRQIHFHYNLGHEGIGITSNLLSLRSNDESIEVFTKLAQMFGGILQPEDTTDHCEMFQTPGKGNARWLMDRFFATNPDVPEDSEKQLAMFNQWVKEQK